MKTCKRITTEKEDEIIEYCKGEMVEFETENKVVLSRFCSKCGLIENYFKPVIITEFMTNAKRVDDGKQ